MFYHAPDAHVRLMLDFLEMKLKCYDLDVQTNNQPVFEVIDTDGTGLGIRSYFDVVQQLETLVTDYKEKESEAENIDQ